MNTLNLRIINTHDTEDNWNNKTTFVPKAGEIIVYDVDKSHTYERFKIGDGTSTITNLPFVIDKTIESVFNIQNSIIYADAGRITDYEESKTS